MLCFYRFVNLSIFPFNENWMPENLNPIIKVIEWMVLCWTVVRINEIPQFRTIQSIRHSIEQHAIKINNTHTQRFRLWCQFQVLQLYFSIRICDSDLKKNPLLINLKKTFQSYFRDYSRIRTQFVLYEMCWDIFHVKWTNYWFVWPKFN